MAQLLPYVDVCIANEEDAADVFGIHAEHTDIEGGKLDYAGYESVACQLSQRFGCKKVAITLRGSISASEILGRACFTMRPRTRRTYPRTI